MKKTVNILLILIMLNIPIFLATQNLSTLILDSEYYSGEFNKLDIYSRFENKNLPDETVASLITYFRSDEVIAPKMKVFTLKENEHLLDVKVLIDKSYVLRYLSLLVIICCVVLLFIMLKHKFLKVFAKWLFLGGLSTIILSFLLVVFGLNFDYFFIKFHHVFFPQGNWMFPYDSTLIKLFPQQFFFDFFVRLIVLSCIQGVLLILIGVYIRKKIKKHSKKAKDI